jgi:hypothetical protein
MEALFDDREPILERAALRTEHTPPERRYWLLQDLETLLEKARSKPDFEKRACVPELCLL